jgi:hypothetical protein
MLREKIIIYLNVFRQLWLALSQVLQRFDDVVNGGVATVCNVALRMAIGFTLHSNIGVTHKVGPDYQMKFQSMEKYQQKQKTGYIYTQIGKREPNTHLKCESCLIQCINYYSVIKAPKRKEKRLSWSVFVLTISIDIWYNSTRKHFSVTNQSCKYFCHEQIIKS